MKAEIKNPKFTITERLVLNDNGEDWIKEIKVTASVDTESKTYKIETSVSSKDIPQEEYNRRLLFERLAIMQFEAADQSDRFLSGEKGLEISGYGQELRNEHEMHLEAETEKYKA